MFSAVKEAKSLGLERVELRGGEGGDYIALVEQRRRSLGERVELRCGEGRDDIALVEQR